MPEATDRPFIKFAVFSVGCCALLAAPAPVAWAQDELLSPDSAQAPTERSQLWRERTRDHIVPKQKPLLRPNDNLPHEDVDSGVADDLDLEIDREIGADFDVEGGPDD